MNYKKILQAIIPYIFTAIMSVIVWEYFQKPPETPKPEIEIVHDTLEITIRDSVPEYKDSTKWKSNGWTSSIRNFRAYNIDSLKLGLTDLAKLKDFPSTEYKRIQETKKYKAEVNIWSKVPPDSASLLVTIKPQVIERELSIVTTDTIKTYYIEEPISFTRKAKYGLIGAGLAAIVYTGLLLIGG